MTPLARLRVGVHLLAGNTDPESDSELEPPSPSRTWRFRLTVGVGVQLQVELRVRVPEQLEGRLLGLELEVSFKLNLKLNNKPLSPRQHDVL